MRAEDGKQEIYLEWPYFAASIDLCHSHSSAALRSIEFPQTLFLRLEGLGATRLHPFVSMQLVAT